MVDSYQLSHKVEPPENKSDDLSVMDVKSCLEDQKKVSYFFE